MADDLYIAWIQTDFGREVVEITSAPQWRVSLPYVRNWRNPKWMVEIRDPYLRDVVWSGQPIVNVRHLHPMNAATRELLKLRESMPPSPLQTPKVVTS